MTKVKDWLAERMKIRNELPARINEQPWGISHYGDAYGEGLFPAQPEGCSLEFGNDLGIDLGTDLALAKSLVDDHNEAPKAYEALTAVLNMHSPFVWEYLHFTVVICRGCAVPGMLDADCPFPCKTRLAIEKVLTS